MLVSTLFLVLAVVSLAMVSGLNHIPERARKGHFFQQLKAHHFAHLPNGQLTATPLTWQAPVDHFDASNNATFAQRYYVDAQYWDKSKGLVFYEIGGEGTLTGPPGGFIAQLAKERGALLVALEHRFYGESIPNGNALTENYNKYLSVEQALADLSSFTDYYKSLVPETKDAKWFVFGGSYPGALSSWYRAAYPAQSVGSLSSSGVVNAIIDYHDFDMSVSAAAGNTCAQDLRNIQAAFKRAVEGGEASFQHALSLFHCEKDMGHNDFYYMIADAWSMMIQYSAKTKSCNAIHLPATATDEQIMKNFADYSNNFWGNDFCSGGFYNTKQLADPARWEVNSRSWRYQTCAQVSYFNTAPPAGSLRAQSVNLQYHLEQCAAAFGQKMFPASRELNQKFGGEFPHAHNVFYSDFSDDPWQRASVNFNLGADQPYFLAMCDDCGHCLDFHSPSASDPAPLTQCRQEFANTMDRWLAEAK